MAEENNNIYDTQIGAMIFCSPILPRGRGRGKGRIMWGLFIYFDSRIKDRRGRPVNLCRTDELTQPMMMALDLHGAICVSGRV